MRSFVSIFIHVTIDKGEAGSLGYIDSNPEPDTVPWFFERKMRDELAEDTSLLESGDYPAFVTAFCNLMRDNLRRSVDIAKSEPFTFSWSAEE